MNFPPKPDQEVCAAETGKVSIEQVTTGHKQTAPGRLSEAERAARKLDRALEQLRTAKARRRAALSEQASRVGFALIEAMRKDPEFKADVLQCIDGPARAELLSIFANGAASA